MGFLQRGGGGGFMEHRKVASGRITLIALLTVSLVSIAAPSQPVFRLKAELRLRPAGPRNRLLHEENIPVTIAAGDFNGDGKPDLVAGSVGNNQSSNELSFFAGRGDGTFAAAASVIRLNARPQQIQAGDFDGNGIADIALVTRAQSHGEGNRLWIFPGSRSGAGQTSYVSDLAEEPRAVFIADFDHDGKPDVAVSSYRSVFLVFRGRGDATFDEPVLACRCDVALVADFNGDHRPDLLTREGNSAAVRMQRGDGTFAPPSAVAGQAFSGLVSAGDLNGDGNTDLAFFDRLAHRIRTWAGNGDGGFRALASLTVPGAVSALRIADLDGDGNSGIFATVWRRTGGELWIFPSRGPSGGPSGRPPVAIPTGYTPSDLCVADFNLDRKPDVGVSSEGAGSVAVFLQQPR